MAHTKVFNKYFFIIYRHSFWGWFCHYQTLWTCQKIKLPELFCYLSSMGIRFNAPSKSTDFLHAYLMVELAHHNSSEKLVLEYLKYIWYTDFTINANITHLIFVRVSLVINQLKEITTCWKKKATVATLVGCGDFLSNDLSNMGVFLLNYRQVVNILTCEWTFAWYSLFDSPFNQLVSTSPWL